MMNYNIESIIKDGDSIAVTAAGHDPSTGAPLTAVATLPISYAKGMRIDKRLVVRVQRDGFIQRMRHVLSLWLATARR